MMAEVAAELRSTPGARGPYPLVSVSAAEVDFGEVRQAQQHCALRLLDDARLDILPRLGGVG